MDCRASCGATYISYNIYIYIHILIVVYRAGIRVVYGGLHKPDEQMISAIVCIGSEALTSNICVPVVAHSVS